MKPGDRTNVYAFPSGEVIGEVMKTIATIHANEQYLGLPLGWETQVHPPNYFGTHEEAAQYVQDCHTPSDEITLWELWL